MLFLTLPDARCIFNSRERISRQFPRLAETERRRCLKRTLTGTGIATDDGIMGSEESGRASERHGISPRADTIFSSVVRGNAVEKNAADPPPHGRLNFAVRFTTRQERRRSCIRKGR